MDAFKGAHYPQRDNQEMRKHEGSSGTRKALLFEESVAMVGLEEAQTAQGGKELEERQMDVEMEKKGATWEEKGVDVDRENQISPLDEANLMVEGVLFSDSELLDEKWEEGEVPEFMEEMEMEPPASKVVVSNDIETATAEDGGEEEAGTKAPKKKGSKPGTGGGAAGTRLVHKLLSPRKTKIAKAPVKNGEGKKAGNKP